MKIFDMDAHPPLTTLSARFIGELDATRFFERLNAAGIDEICGTLTPPDGFFADYPIAEAIRRLNDGAMELAAKDARYQPVIAVHPDAEDASIRAIEDATAYGIFSVHPLTSSGEAMHSILQAASVSGMTAILTRSSEAEIGQLSEALPSLRILCGGRMSPIFLNRISDMIARHPNVYLNINAQDWNWNYILHEKIAALPTDRLVFGSGYPYTNPASAVAAAKWELRDASEKTRDAIFRANAEKLIGGMN